MNTYAFGIYLLFWPVFAISYYVMMHYYSASVNYSAISVFAALLCLWIPATMIAGFVAYAWPLIAFAAYMCWPYFQ